jgi:hypothetical protein
MVIYGLWWLETKNYKAWQWLTTSDLVVEVVVVVVVVAKINFKCSSVNHMNLLDYFNDKKSQALW